jgi:hypothetical protein
MARDYGLDPLLGEFMVYQGNPYITVAARLRKAQETDQLDGIVSRPSTKEEREGRGCKDGDILILVEVYKKGCTHPFQGWGKVRKEEYVGADSHLPIAKDPYDMAEKRGTARGLKRAFSIPLPSYEDVGSGEGDDISVVTEEKSTIKTRATRVSKKESVADVSNTINGEAKEISPQNANSGGIKDLPAVTKETEVSVTEYEKSRSATPLTGEAPAVTEKRPGQAWLVEALKKIHWNDRVVKSMLEGVPYKLTDLTGSGYDCVCRLSEELQDAFYAKIKDLVSISGR